jgi:hypothetical protein
MQYNQDHQATALTALNEMIDVAITRAKQEPDTLTTGVSYSSGQVIGPMKRTDLDMDILISHARTRLHPQWDEVSLILTTYDGINMYLYFTLRWVDQIKNIDQQVLS